jgi:hypothetical protein
LILLNSSPSVPKSALAQKAKAFTAGFLPAGSIVILRKIKADKYRGRYDADVQRSDGRELAAGPIGAGLARPHEGEGRTGWCAIDDR